MSLDRLKDQFRRVRGIIAVVELPIEPQIESRKRRKERAHGDLAASLTLYMKAENPAERRVALNSHSSALDEVLDMGGVSLAQSRCLKVGPLMIPLPPRIIA